MSQAAQARFDALKAAPFVDINGVKVAPNWTYATGPSGQAVVFNPQDPTQRTVIKSNSPEFNNVADYLTSVHKTKLYDNNELGQFFGDLGNTNGYSNVFNEPTQKVGVLPADKIYNDTQANPAAPNNPNNPAQNNSVVDPNKDIPQNKFSTNTGAPNPAFDPNAAPITAPKAPALALTQGNLQVGSQGAEVSQLQSLLGATTDGKFGPQTQAAVKAFQAANGLVADGIVGPKTLAALNKSKAGPSGADNVGAGAGGGNTGGGSSNTGTKIPATGNTTIDSLISVLNNQSPQKSFSDVYKEIYKSMGLDTMKADYTAQTKAFTDLQDEKNNEAQKINNDPWLSEGVRQEKLKQLDNKYQGKETILTNKLKLLETNISNGRADAQFVAGKTLDQLQQSSKLTEDVIMKAIDIAEKQAEAEAAANKPVSVGENSRLVDPKTGKVVVNASPNSSKTKVTVGNYAPAFDKSQKYTDSKGKPVFDSNGFATVNAWKELIADAVKHNVTRTSFIKQYGSYLYLKDLASYGLTAPEQKLISGSTSSRQL